MKISIITATYNSGKTIYRNVESVLEQSYPGFEQIMVDNKSEDDTLKIAAGLYESRDLSSSLKIISEKDRGISDAFNKGINAATGEIIAILNGDDNYFNNRVFKKVAELMNDPECLFVYGDIYFEDELYGSNIRQPLLCDVTVGMPFNHPAMFIRKSVYEMTGGYDEEFRYAMDFEFICRLERLIPDFRLKGKYISDFPLAVMRAGGASWKHELKSIEEVKQALIKNGFWNSSAARHYKSRLFRTKMKKYLSLTGLSGIVKLWRKLKWKS